MVNLGKLFIRQNILFRKNPGSGKEACNRQNRHAVYWINRRIYRGLHQRSFGMKTDADYLEKLMTTYPSVPAEDWKKYLCIVQKAVFSEEEISQEEARFCYRLYRKYRNRRILGK